MTPVLAAVALTLSLIVLLVVGIALRRRAFDRQMRARIEALAALPPAGLFSRDELEGLPEPAQRYLRHALGPGAPLARRVRLKMHGEVRLQPLGTWQPFHAEQVLAPSEGFVWWASLGEGSRGRRYAETLGPDGAARSARVLGAPVLRVADDEDRARAAAGRLVAECVWLPTVLLPSLGARWEPVDDERARVEVSTPFSAAPLTLRVYEDGSLRSVSTTRWDDRTEEGGFGWVPFHVTVDEEERFGRYTIPSRIRVTWGAGTPRAWELFRVQILEADFLT